MSKCKSCTQCGEAKPLDEFHRDSQKPDGLRSNCKACSKVADAKYREQNRERNRNRMGDDGEYKGDTGKCKSCTQCGEVKALDEFYHNVSMADGRESCCNVCSNAACAEWRERNRERNRNRRGDDGEYEGDAKKCKSCTQCGEVKALDEFYHNASTGDGLSTHCKACQKVIRAEYHAKNRDAENAKQAERRKNNPEKKAAHSAVETAIRNGTLVRKPCEVCGSIEEVEGHHDDYSKPLKVRWLCPKHHRRHHEQLKVLEGIST